MQLRSHRGNRRFFFYPSCNTAWCINSGAAWRPWLKPTICLQNTRSRETVRSKFLLQVIRSSRMIPCGKLSYSTFKKRLKTQQGIVQHWEFCNIPREPHRESSIMPSRRVLWTNVKGELGKFSLVGKHPLGEKNFPFDIGSKRNNWERSHIAHGVKGKLLLSPSWRIQSDLLCDGSPRVLTIGSAIKLNSTTWRKRHEQFASRNIRGPKYYRMSIFPQKIACND